MKKFFRPIRFAVFFRQGNGPTRMLANNLRLDAAWRKVDEIAQQGDGHTWLMPL